MTVWRWLGLVFLCLFVYYVPQLWAVEGDFYFVVQSSWSLGLIIVALVIYQNRVTYLITMIEISAIYGASQALAGNVELEAYYNAIDALFVLEVLVLISGVPRGMVRRILHSCARPFVNRRISVH